MIDSVTKGKIKEFKSFTTFNKVAEDLLTQFSKETSKSIHNNKISVEKLS